MRSRILFLLLTCPVVTQAQELDSRPLAAYLPDGAAVVLRVHQLAQTIEDLKGTPLADAVSSGPIARHLKQTGKLAEIKSHLQEVNTALGIDVIQTAHTLAAEEALLAIYPK